MAENEEKKETVKTEETDEKETGLKIETKDDLMNFLESLQSDLKILKESQQTAPAPKKEVETVEEKTEEIDEEKEVDEIEEMLKSI